MRAYLPNDARDLRRAEVTRVGDPDGNAREVAVAELLLVAVQAGRRAKAILTPR